MGCSAGTTTIASGSTAASIARTTSWTSYQTGGGLGVPGHESWERVSACPGRSTTMILNAIEPKHEHANPIFDYVPLRTIHIGM